MTVRAIVHPVVGVKGLQNGINIGGTTIYAGDGTPQSTYYALRIGDLYVDYTNGATYQASATGLSNWVAFAGLSSMASGATLGGTYWFTHAGAPTDTAIRIGDISINYSYGSLNMAAATGTSDWVRIGVASTSSVPFAINTAGAIGLQNYWTSTATSDTTYGRKNTLTASGIGVEAIAGRDRTILSAVAANAHGLHATLEVKNTGKVSGLGTGIRGNIVFATDTAVTTGTYYGVLAEIYAIGNTGALPAGSNACLGINLQPGTAIDAVGNAISFSGTDGATSMIYTHTAAPTVTGYIRVLVNGAVRYMHFSSAIA